MFRIPIAYAALALACASAHAAGTVQVNLVNPDRFADFRDLNATVEQNAKALEQAIVDAASPYVADGQTLKIEVLDVDLAGEPKRGRALDIRVLRGGTDWPSITLRWTLEAAGTAPRSGNAVVKDMNYLDRSPPSKPSVSLAHERRMLADWFRVEFGKGAG